MRENKYEMMNNLCLIYHEAIGGKLKSFPVFSILFYTFAIQANAAYNRIFFSQVRQAFPIYV